MAYTAQVRQVWILFFFAIWPGTQLCKSVAAVSAVNSRTGQDQAHKSDPQISQTPPHDKVTFTNLAIIDGYDPSDDTLAVNPEHKDDPYVHVWFHGGSYRSSDGRTLTAETANLVTPALAASYLERKLRTAKIIDRKPRKNQKGEIVGERIIALFSVPASPDRAGPDDPHTTIASVIRTNGTIYYVISANPIGVPASLDDVLALEEHLDKLNTAVGALRGRS